MIHIGVIGTGGMGARHARNLATQTHGAQVVAVMDIDRARAAALAAEIGEATVYTDALALIEAAPVEAVLIASPDSTHAELTLACLNAGKPVLCEKPLAATLAEAEKVLRAEVDVGRRLVQVGFMREYDRAHQQVKAVVERGELGRPLLFRGVHNHLSLGYDRTTEDVIINSAIHDIHSTRWLMGQEIDRVFVQCVAADSNRPETCRLLLLQMTLRDGSLAIIEVNGDSDYGYEVDVEITGEHGSVRTTSLRSPVVRQAGSRSQAIEPDWLERFDSAYVEEVRTWVHSLLVQEPTGPSTWDGYVSLVVADVCINSAKTGQPQTVLHLEPPEFYRRS
jgi:myo-inositol 2-dehydrogenase/D-chiro-inositol 1-dehydrogenase